MRNDHFCFLCPWDKIILFFHTLTPHTHTHKHKKERTIFVSCALGTKLFYFFIILILKNDILIYIIYTVYIVCIRKNFFLNTTKPEPFFGIRF